MGKETSIGLVVIALLLGTFGYVLYQRLKKEQEVAQADTAAKAGEKEKPDAATKPSGASKKSTIAGMLSAKEPETTSADPFAATAANPLPRTADNGNHTSTTSPTSPHFASQQNTAGNDRYAGRYNMYGDAPSGTTPQAQPEDAATTTADPFQRYASQSPAEPRPAEADGHDHFSSPASAGGRQAFRDEALAETPPLSSDRLNNNPLRRELSNPEPPSGGRSDPLARPAEAELNNGLQSDRYGSTAFSPAGKREASTASTSEGAGFRSPATTRLYGDTSHSMPGSAAALPTRAAAPLTSLSGTSAPLTSPPLRRNDESYVVEPNDNFWSISEKVYGTGHYFKALQEHNRHSYPQPDLLQPGDIVSTPSTDMLLKRYSDLCPRPHKVQQSRRAAGALSSQRQPPQGRVYVVEEGDTLFDIARYELGKASRWAEIYELNRELIGEDMNHLTPGLTLSLPSDGPADSITRRPPPFSHDNSLPRR